MIERILAVNPVTKPTDQLVIFADEQVTTSPGEPTVLGLIYFS